MGHQGVDEVGFSHKADHTIGTLLSENASKSIRPPNEAGQSREDGASLDRQIHRDQPSLEGVALPLLKYHQQDFTYPESER